MARTARKAENEAFARLLARHQQEIYRCVFAMVPNDSDALDIVQDTAVLLMSRFDEYVPDRPFLPWACAFARNVALSFIAKRTRHAKHCVCLSPEVIQVIATERSDYTGVLEARRSALAGCLDQLEPDDRQLLELRYGRNASISRSAKHIGKSRDRLYRRIRKLRSALSACIESKRAGQGDI